MLDSLALSASQRNALAEAAHRYHNTVEDVAPYLAGRGLTKAHADSFLLGAVSDPMPGHERFRGMVSIPYLTPAGVVGFKFRCPAVDHSCKAESHPKYDSPAGQQSRLYNVGALHGDSNVIAIVEGELKALICTAVVGVPAVGTPGTQWTKEHPHFARVFADFEHVVVVADHDLNEDGRTDQGRGVGHAKKVAASLGGRVVMPPPGLDLDEWVAKEGAEAVREGMGL